MSRTVDLTGQVFGRLTVIERSVGKSTCAWWLCKCCCGNEKVVMSSDLRKGKVKSCGCLRKEYQKKTGKHHDITGMRSGKLTVLEFSHSDKGVVYWKCICDCGNSITVQADNLRRKVNTKSCGCLVTERTKSRITHKRGVSSINAHYGTYRRNALNRNYVFDLGLDEFTELVKLPCYYCGRMPESDYGKIPVNGIDRKNNSTGYTLENVVTCCSKCNIAKHTMNMEEFRNWAISLAKEFLNYD